MRRPKENRKLRGNLKASQKYQSRSESLFPHYQPGQIALHRQSSTSSLIGSHLPISACLGSNVVVRIGSADLEIWSWSFKLRQTISSRVSWTTRHLDQVTESRNKTTNSPGKLVSKEDPLKQCSVLFLHLAAMRDSNVFLYA